jgi:hypothetical protein
MRYRLFHLTDLGRLPMPRIPHPADRAAYLLAVYDVIQFGHPGGEWPGAQQVQFYVVLDLHKQGNAPSKNDRIDKEPVAVDQIQLNK